MKEQISFIDYWNSTTSRTKHYFAAGILAFGLAAGAIGFKAGHDWRNGEINRLENQVETAQHSTLRVYQHIDEVFSRLPNYNKYASYIGYEESEWETDLKKYYDLGKKCEAEHN
jgi:hypothetical protein